MKKYLKLYAKNFDYPLFIVYVVLCIFGLVMVYSSSMMIAMAKNLPSDYFYKKQLFNLIIGFFVFIVGAFFPYKHYSRKKLMVTLTFIMFMLLIWLLLFGIEVNGSKSWIDIFGLTRFQPSEFAKLFIILYFSGAFYRKSLNNPIENLKPNNIAYPLIIWLFVIFFVANETDLGAVAIISCIAMAVIAASGMSFKRYVKFLLVLIVFGALVLGSIILIKGDEILTGNRLGRIQAFLNPFEDSEKYGYQIVNGYIAIGSGGLKGEGLGQSIQKLGFLPEPQTDFILAVIAEELGLFGVLIVIGGLSFIVFRALFIALKTKDPLARMIAAGIASWIAIQAFINIGGVSGLIPLTGVTLPFISYGGTSIIMLSLATGILLNISMYVKLEKNK